MAKIYKTPGVYVDEVVKFPPTVSEVATAIPIFIGYTEKAITVESENLNLKPTKIESLLDYECLFGKASKETKITVVVFNNTISLIFKEAEKSPFLLYHSLQLYFANGGGACYIVSVGQYGSGQNPKTVVDFNPLNNGLQEAAKADEPTLLLFPDATSLAFDADFYKLYNNALKQCYELKDRFTIIDSYSDTKYDEKDPITSLRSGISLSPDYLKYGAAYFPFLETAFKYDYEETQIEVLFTNYKSRKSQKLSEVEGSDNLLYNKIKKEISLLNVKLPPSSAIAGIYATTDNNRGVWKAPANISLNSLIKPTVKITNRDQENLNIDAVEGKSINAIITFPGKGTLVWGARTLAGNDNEWRYIPVRRFCNMVEESIQKAMLPFVFEANGPHTWIRIKAMIENFLFTLWQKGALFGAKPEQAFFVRVGLGQTMNSIDVLERRLIVEIGLATVRPAEFIILRLTQKMQIS